VNSRNFFAELKRRNVYKVAVAYAVVGWLSVQVATQVFPFLEIPNWIVRLVIALVVIGFPIALVIAWAFEATSEGIKRTEIAQPSPATSGENNRAWIYIVIIGAVLSIGLFFLGRYTVATKAPSPNDLANKSIAVLPFESLSEDKSNAYFADGIQDEILARLSKIADLKVISRTSTQKYKSAPNDLREIAQRLGVANILEGSVQKANDQVRVTVQLINALNDSHLWAETYDRKLIDVFAAESDIAQKVAASLEAKLTGREKEDIQFAGTKNPQAYDALLRALALRNSSSRVDLEKQIEFSRHAVELDPNYADAWANLALTEIYKSQTPWRSKEQIERARTAAETALRLTPNSANAHKAMGLFYRYCLKDDRAALAELETARERAPNDGGVLEAVGLLQRAQGRIQDALATLKKAADLDPLNAEIWIQLALTYAGLRQFEAAHLMVDRALAITPDDLDTLAGKASFYQAQGDLDAAWRLIGSRPFPRTEWAGLIYYQQYYLRRDYDKLIAEFGAFDLTDKNLPPMVVTWVRAALGSLRLLKGQRELATPDAEKVRRAIKELQAQNIVQPELYRPSIEFAARLGDRAEVEDEIAFILAYTRDNQWILPSAEYNAARGYAVLGDMEKALPLLQDSLSKPNGTTTAILRLDPAWDGVRNDSRFQKLANAKP
jgi:TolB-like protein